MFTFWMLLSDSKYSVDKLPQAVSSAYKGAVLQKPLWKVSTAMHGFSIRWWDSCMDPFGMSHYKRLLKRNLCVCIMIKYQLWTRIIQPAIYFRWKGFTSSLQYQGLAFHSIIYKTLLTSIPLSMDEEITLIFLQRLSQLKVAKFLTGRSTRRSTMNIAI